MAIDAAGIPRCNPNIQFEEIGPWGSICKGSILGEGSARFEIAPSESSPMLVNGMVNAKLVLIYRGISGDGVMTLFANAYLKAARSGCAEDQARSQEDPQGTIRLAGGSENSDHLRAAS